MPDSQTIRTALSIMFAGAALVAATVCMLAIAAQVFTGFAPLEMIASFLPQVLIFSIPAALGAFWFRPRLAIAATIIVLIASGPFVLFSKYERPTGNTCAPDECLTVMTANIWGKKKAMAALHDLAVRERVDVIGINEAVSLMTVEDYREAFPGYPYVIHAAWENMPSHMGNPITLLSRLPIAESDRVLRYDTARRAYIWADLSEDWSDIRIAIAHAMTPTSAAGVKARNTLLRATAETATASETFILMGDFNLTPWMREFRKLPGKRAGDPRFTRTWPTADPLLGMAIDHIMFSTDLELVEYRKLESVGSDHYPILARYRRETKPTD